MYGVVVEDGSCSCEELVHVTYLNSAFVHYLWLHREFVTCAEQLTLQWKMMKVAREDLVHITYLRNQFVKYLCLHTEFVTCVELHKCIYFSIYFSHLLRNTCIHRDIFTT